MAGEWIKLRCDLHDDPSVILISQETGLDIFAVVGRLAKFWSWANRQLRFGYAPSVTTFWIDVTLQCEGFAEAMQKAGWLEVTNEGISIPNFEAHNSKSAKQRSLAQRRMLRKRYASIVTKNEQERNQRREEKSTSKHSLEDRAHSARRFQKPSLGELERHAATIGLPNSEVGKFFHYYESKGWKVGKAPMKSWKAAMAGWKTRWQEQRSEQARGKVGDLEASVLARRIEQA